MEQSQPVNYKLLSPQQVDYQSLPPEQLVNLFAYKVHRNHAITALIGGLTATELRMIQLTDVARAALIKGLEHTNPKVRWWCLQMMDHVGDERCIEPMLRALDDPVLNIRRMAQHALECEKCKQSPLVAQTVRQALALHRPQPQE